MFYPIILGANTTPDQDAYDFEFRAAIVFPSSMFSAITEISEDSVKMYNNLIQFILEECGDNVEVVFDSKDLFNSKLEKNENGKVFVTLRGSKERSIDIFTKICKFVQDTNKEHRKRSNEKRSNTAKSAIGAYTVGYQTSTLSPTSPPPSLTGMGNNSISQSQPITTTYSSTNLVNNKLSSAFLYASTDSSKKNTAVQAATDIQLVSNNNHGEKQKVHKVKDFFNSLFFRRK